MTRHPLATIRTRYVTRPGSNVGGFRATAAGRQVTIVDQSLTNPHRAAAVELAGRIMTPQGRLGVPAWIPAGEAFVPLEGAAQGNGGYVFDILAPWSADEARTMRDTARYQLANHGHPWPADELTRENCGACALAGYGATADGPGYGAWARVYVQAGRPIPAEWRDAFARELAGSDPHNPRYADCLRRDLLMWGAQ